MKKKEPNEADYEGEELRVLQGRVPDSIHNTWHEFATQQGTSVTALMIVLGEVFGRLLVLEPDEVRNIEANSQLGVAWLTRARRLAGEARRRRT